jgi:hypothetical protein
VRDIGPDAYSLKNKKNWQPDLNPHIYLKPSYEKG